VVQTGGGVYTVSNVLANHSLQVTFARMRTGIYSRFARWASTEGPVQARVCGSREPLDSKYAIQPAGPE
jgi:hypothetical protein